MLFPLEQCASSDIAPSSTPPPRGYRFNLLYDEPSIQVVTDSFILDEEDTSIIFTLYRQGALSMPRLPRRLGTQMVNGLNTQTVLLRHSARQATAMLDLIQRTHRQDRHRNTVLSQAVGLFIHDLSKSLDSAFYSPFTQRVNAVTDIAI